MVNIFMNKMKNEGFRKMLNEEFAIYTDACIDNFLHGNEFRRVQKGKKLIEKFGKPIVSTSANLSGQPTACNVKEINTKILKEVDYVVNLPSTNSCNSASSIIKINLDGTISKIR